MAEENNEEQDKKIGIYEQIDVIAGGNSCTIWEVSDGNQTWAMKLLLEDKLADAEERNALRHEGKILQQLSHPAFVAFRDMSISRKAAYIVMEYFRGPNLKQLLKANRYLLHAQFEKLLEQACLGLGYLHEKGYVSDDLLDPLLNVLNAFVATPGGKDWWEEIGPMLSISSYFESKRNHQSVPFTDLMPYFRETDSADDT